MRLERRRLVVDRSNSEYVLRLADVLSTEGPAESATRAISQVDWVIGMASRVETHSNTAK